VVLPLLLKFHQETTMKLIPRDTLRSTAAAVSGVIAVALSFAPAVHAQDVPEPRKTLVVNYGDLNLDSDQGAKLLLERLRQAAQGVCEPLEGRPLSVRNRWLICYDQALASAVAHINKPSVSALYQASLTRPDQG
jgi:UrcA family protein